MKTDTLDTLQKMVSCANNIKKGIEHYDTKSREQNCDKYNMGFNLDNRFSCFSMNISIDSWLGYYGNSGCSNAISNLDKEIFGKALNRYLNTNFRKIMESCRLDILNGAKELKEKSLAEIEEVRKKVESIGNYGEDK